MAEYIEREALIEDIENACVFSGRPDHQNPKQMGARLVVQRIRCAPAADVAPVVHGRWISLTECANEGVYCSVCNKKVYKADYAWSNKRIKMRSNYCPNCGARMDGE